MMNIVGHKHDCAGVTAAWSVLYLMLERRSKKKYLQWNRSNWQFWVRGAMVPMCVMNAVGGGLVYLTEKRTVDESLFKEAYQHWKSLYG